MGITRLRIRVARTFYAAWQRRPFRPSPTVRQVREILDMHDLGVALYRQRMRRENPQATEAGLDIMVRDWILRPSAGHHWPAAAPGPGAGS